MSDNYQGLPKSEQWGCVAAALVGAPVFLFLFTLDATGDCAPGSSCGKGFWLNVALPSFAVTALAFWAIRTIVRRMR